MPTNFTYERLRFSDINELFKSIVLDLTGRNENALLPDAAKFEFISPFDEFALPSATSVLLRASTKVDPLFPATPAADDLVWGISLYIESNTIKMSWGRMRFDGSSNPVNQGELNTDSQGSTFESLSMAGNIAQLTAATRTDTGTKDVSPSALHGYRLTLSDRGFSLVVFHQNKIKNWKQFGAVLLQRPVKNDGVTLTTGKAPIFVVFNNLDFSAAASTFGDPRWYKSVLWETDVAQSVGTDVHIEVTPTTVDPQPNKKPNTIRNIHFENPNTLYAFPVNWETPITQDNNEVPLVFPFGLTTDRFSYLENMDLMAVGPACVFTFGQIIDLTVFGQARQYQIYSASEPCNGVIVAVLVDGPNF